MLITFIMLYIISIVFNNFVYNKKNNFINIVISIWFIFSILSIINPYNMIQPTEVTYTYILVFLISFEIFSFIFYKLKYNLKTDTKDDKTINWKLMNIIIFICCIIMMYFAIKGLSIYINTRSFSNIRNAYLNCEFISNKMEMFLSIAIIPLGTAIGVYSIIDYIENKKIKLSLILYLFFLVEVILTTGGRNKIIYFAIIILIALFDKYSGNIIKLIKNNSKIIIFLVIIFCIVLGITLQRNLSGKGFLYNIYAYFAGSIHLLGVYLSDTNRYLINGENLLYGQVLISGFFYPITFIMRLLGSDIKAGIYIVNETTQVFTAISSDTMINNNVTCIYSALRDFGIYGLVIYPLIISFIMINLYKKKNKCPNIYNRAMYYYFLVNVIFLIFDFNFSNPTIIFVYIYIYIINKLCKKRKI